MMVDALMKMAPIAMGIVMPHGVLFRGSAEGKIRKGLIGEDLIETIVGLPTNLFYGTGIPAAILIVNRDKPKARKGKVLFVEASREFRDASNQNFLREADVSKIAETVHAFKDVRSVRVQPGGWYPADMEPSDLPVQEPGPRDTPWKTHRSSAGKQSPPRAPWTEIKRRRRRRRRK